MYVCMYGNTWCNMHVCVYVCMTGCQLWPQVIPTKEMLVNLWQIGWVTSAIYERNVDVGVFYFLFSIWTRDTERYDMIACGEIFSSRCVWMFWFYYEVHICWIIVISDLGSEIQTTSSISQERTIYGHDKGKNKIKWYYKIQKRINKYRIFLCVIFQHLLSSTFGLLLFFVTAFGALASIDVKRKEGKSMHRHQPRWGISVTTKKCHLTMILLYFWEILIANSIILSLV